MPMRLRSRLCDSKSVCIDDRKSAISISREFIRFPGEENSKARFKAAATSRADEQLASVIVRRYDQTDPISIVRAPIRREFVVFQGITLWKNCG